MTIRLTYNSNNIDLNIGNSGIRINPMHNQRVNKSSSGIIETFNMHGIEEIRFDTVFQQTVYNQLYTFFWSWMRLGKAFSFTMDFARAFDTTLDGTVSGAVVPLTSTAGISVGEQYVIIADGNAEREIIEVQSVSAGVSVTATASLANSFVDGDVLRHWQYYPALKSIDNKSFNPKKTGQWYSHTFKWVEDLNA